MAHGPVFVLAFLTAIVGCQGRQVRPLYIAGFMANSIYDVDSYIEAGANVIEADLLFDKQTGQALQFNKGFPCDCFRMCNKREGIINYLQHFKEITTPGHPKYKIHFTGILLIDAVMSSTDKLDYAGEDMARILDTYLYSNENNAKIIFEIGGPIYRGFIDSLIKNLRARGRADLLNKIGLASAAGRYYKEFIALASETGLGLWMGDGITNCLEDFFKLKDVREACRLRDNGQGVSKVIRWTVDLKRNIRNAMWLGVDVIGTNDVHDVLAVMKEEEFTGRYRLATPNDDPFVRIKGVGPLRYGCRKPSIFKGRYVCWKDKDPSGSWCDVNKECTNNKSDCEDGVELPCS